jgi:hypothetical protein
MTTTREIVGPLLVIAALTGCTATERGEPAVEPIDPIEDGSPVDGTAPLGEIAAAPLPPGALQASVVEIPDQSALLATVTQRDNVYIHDQATGAWYYKSGGYLLGIESFTQYHQQLDRRIDFDSGDLVAPAQTRVVGLRARSGDWQLPQLTGAGDWPAAVDSVWVAGTENGRFGMGGAPQAIPIGTEVFGSMQTYGGALSTPYLFADASTHPDETRIRAAATIGPDTLLGGHSAGASVARRIALDVGVDHVWLYGTPNDGRGSGAYVKTETSDGHTMVAEIINNHDDPVTHVLLTPWKLVTLAWGTAKCHNYSNWDYQRTSPVTVVCP